MLHIHLLERFAVSVHDKPIPEPAWRGKNARNLLRLLALGPEQGIRTGTIIDTLFAHLPLDQARRSLYVTVNRLRHALSSVDPAGSAGTDSVLSVRDGYRLGEATWVDVRELIRLSASVHTLYRQNPQAALQLIHGSEWNRPRAFRMDSDLDWMAQTEHQVQQAYISLCVTHAGLLLGDGRPEEALDHLLNVLELEPARESTARQAMMIAYELKDQVRALEIFEQCRRALAEELGVDPMPETFALYRRVLEQGSHISAREELRPEALGSALLAARICGTDPDETVITRELEELRKRLIGAGGSGIRAAFNRDILVARFGSPYQALLAALTLQGFRDQRNRLALGVSCSGEEASHPARLQEASEHASLLGLFARAGQVLLSHDTAVRIQDMVPAGARLESLGWQMLPDMNTSERLYLLGAGSSDDSSSVPDPELPHHNLPIQTTPFIGRVGEVREISRLILRQRLVTLTGVSGMGKTRLAIHVGGSLLRRFPDGVKMVDLSLAHDMEQAARAISELMDLQPDAAEGDFRANLVTYLHDRRLLLILDGCEHLTALVAPIVAQILQTAPQVRVLVTSQHSLRLSGETVWVVPPLAVPQGEELEEVLACESARFFCSRAQAESAFFRVQQQDVLSLVRICRQLDGIPLALELAAGWTRLLPLSQIAARLSNRFQMLRGRDKVLPQRQHTLYNALEWSYRLLTEPERCLWRNLSVFAGGFSLEAAEAVCRDLPVLNENLLETLASLVDKSILVVQPGRSVWRYRLLDPLREYGEEQLRHAGEEERARDSQLDWSLALAREAAGQMANHSQSEWLQRIDSERDNLRAALQWSVKREKTAEALAIATGLRACWEVRGCGPEDRELLASFPHEGIAVINEQRI